MSNALFIEAEFPRTISYKAMGGPAFNTTVNEGKSGFEQRNANWQVVRGEWTVSLDQPGPSSNVNPQTYIDQLTAFFLVVGGKANGFRLKDHKDFTNGSIAQQLGVSDAIACNYQLLKQYIAAGRSYVRRIVKPMTSQVVNYLGFALTDTVDIYLNGGAALAKNVGYNAGGVSRYSLDETTGTVSFGSCQSKLNIIGFQSVNGYARYLIATQAGPLPIKNQQVFISGIPTSALDGTFLITGVGPKGAYIDTNCPCGFTDLTQVATGYIGWSKVAITSVVATGTTSVYSYTLTLGAALSIGMRVCVTGMTGTNNGTFYITALGAGTFTVFNPAAGTTETQAGIGITDWTPVVGVMITWTGQYHFPVRFDTDKLALQLEESDVEGGHPIVTWNSIILKELRIANGASQG